MLQRIRLLGASLMLLALCTSAIEATWASICASVLESTHVAELAADAQEDGHAEDAMPGSAHSDCARGAATSSPAEPASEPTPPCPLFPSTLTGCMLSATLPAAGLTTVTPTHAVLATFSAVTPLPDDLLARVLFRPPRG